MCMKSDTEESCKLNETVAALGKRVDSIEVRLEAVETVTRDGLAAVNANIETLSQQMTNMDKRIIDEKTKWGDLTRSMVKWTTRAILVIVVYAAGVNLTKDAVASFAAKLFN